jgi:hypothetical protein
MLSKSRFISDHPGFRDEIVALAWSLSSCRRRIDGLALGFSNRVAYEVTVLLSLLKILFRQHQPEAARDGKDHDGKSEQELMTVPRPAIRIRRRSAAGSRA